MKFWMAPGGLHIEPASSGDAEAMAKLHGSSFFRGWPKSEFISYIADQATTPTYVAIDPKRRLAGFVVLRLAADEVELLTIAVNRKWQGRGLGRALMQATFADLLLTPAQRMFLEVEDENRPALALYNRLGFVEINRRKGYYPKADGSAATALVMRRDLE